MALLTKERFFELAAGCGANRWLASDLWYYRPLQHLADPEDILKINFEVMRASGWITKNNPQAEALQRHEYLPGSRAGRKCDVCDNHRRSAVHNTEPLREQKAITAGESIQ